MENCRAKRISGAWAAAAVASMASASPVDSATAGSRAARTSTARNMSLPPWISAARSGHKPRVVPGRHDLHPAHVARLIGTVIGHGIVHGADIVPHQHVACAPLVRVEIFLVLLVLEQKAQQLGAFNLRHP